MNTVSRLAILMLLFFSPWASFAGDSNGPPKSGDVFPDISLPLPEAAEHRAYLGLPEDAGSFKTECIKTRILIIEIFSMYCPHCQREAPEVNTFYESIVNNEALRDRIKMIGIGAGNSEYEVEVYRTTYNVAFPLFPDPDYKIHKRLGEVRTPYFFGIAVNARGPDQVFYSELGGLDGAERFLEHIRESAKPFLED